MESEFFGYKKGSFTGADADRLGFFQHADGGTLFLDEVADLPLAMQVKLLRAIQEKAVRRIGDAHETQIDVRIVCATHKNLEALVASALSARICITASTWCRCTCRRCVKCVKIRAA